MTVRLYNPTELSIVVAGFSMGGFAVDSMLEIAYNADASSLAIGVDGKPSRSKSSDLSARVTIHLAQTSPSNDVLSVIFLADQASPLGVPVPFLCRDRNGRSIYGAETIWITKMPDSVFNNTIQPRSWVLETGVLIPFVGGNPQAEVAGPSA